MPSISIKTAIPGPKSQELMARRKAAVSNSPFIVTPLFIDHGSGATLTDVDGNTYLDFAGGIGTVNVGHAHPKVVDAIQQQAGKFLHTCFNVAMYEPYVALAEKLNRIVPVKGPRKSVLFNSGAEAVENAVKIARNVTKRQGVLTFEHGFAGRTYMALSLTSKAAPYKSGFGPFMPEVYRLPYPYLYRSTFTDENAYVDHCLAEVKTFFQTHVDPATVACLWMELVTGEGGFLVAPVRYVQGLKKICEQHGILFIADEIQTGFCRTGKLFATEHYGIEPDLMTLAKSIAGGLPLSAVVGRADLLDGVQVGGLGGTYCGNPVACAAALATIEVYERDHIADHAAQLGRQVMQRLVKWKSEFPWVGEVRGLGAMCAIEFVKDRATKEAAKETLAAISKACYERGVILISSGTNSNIMRFLFPLVATKDQIDEGLDVIESVMRGMKAG
ncbi:MAG TPA: 4-aminobutyrate--2-oxoglutarate transaminase [Kiritimatiellia bacterium]|nr:4-aminobutyrate--2-oxoglutarate transaminase [Kiritimatiellia bacterium]HMP33035.1 4-aminobutyrate--2-oxoglutarate transaminase [Kiritimatiellia bacterium]